MSDLLQSPEICMMSAVAGLYAGNIKSIKQPYKLAGKIN